MPRRPGPLRSALPWIFAAALVGLVGNRLHEALKTSDDELVAHAESLRVGDLGQEVPKDPIAALHVLEPLIEREPGHFGALLAAARAWGDLRSWERAVELLDTAVASAASPAQACIAWRMAGSYLILADRYDDAVAAAQKVVDLLPGTALPQLQLGAALYRGSVAAQAAVVALFVGPDRSEREVLIERRIEDFITDLWREPDVAQLVAQLAAEADSAFRDDVRARLLDARQRFLAASDAMAGFRDFDGFDLQVAQSYVELLLRSGRIFEAHLEASTALRRDDIPVLSRRSLLESQARCLMVMDEHGLAATAFQEIVDGYDAAEGWVPPRYLGFAIEARVLARDWDWILAQDKRMTRVSDGDIWWHYAVAEALFARGDAAAARSRILDPFATVSLGTLLPPTVRGEPARRRAILMLAHRALAAAGDSGALAALDALLDKFPDDLEGRRLRVEILTSQGFLSGALDDAYRLLRRDRRDGADFERWLSIADELSVQRHGEGLAARAAERVDDESDLRRSALDAVFQGSLVKQRKGASPLFDPNLAFPSQDPALAFETIRERIRRNDLERARNDCRQLVQAHPQVQEFRYRLARLLVREGRHEAAVADFLAILEDIPGDTEVLDLTMRVEMVRGRPAAAAALANEMILADPLGVGAVRYAQILLQDGAAARAQRLIERLVAHSIDDPGLDLLVMGARAQLAQGEFEAAGAVLESLHENHPESEDVALLGLELGLAQGHEGLVAAAVKSLQPLSAGLFPDQVAQLGGQLLAVQRYQELLDVFPAEQRELPALRPTLRPLAQAAKALGEIDESDRLLGLAGDPQSLRDRFLLLTMDGRLDVASRRLRLQPGSGADAGDLDLCLLAGSALGQAVVLTDSEPTARLRDLVAEGALDSTGLEFLDALLRILPLVERPEAVIPPRVVKAPLETYPRAGPQVARFIELALADPQAAREAGTSLLLMLLAGERTFWERETLLLAEHVLQHLPGLESPSILLARRRLDQGQAREALAILRPVLAAPEPDLGALEVFLEASAAFGKAEWGVALSLLLQDGRPPVKQVLADSLLDGGHPEEALPLYEELAALPGRDNQLLGRLVHAASLARDEGLVVTGAREALVRHPDDAELLATCAEALAGLRTPDEQELALMEACSAAVPSALRLDDALARALLHDPARCVPVLERFAGRAGAAAPPTTAAEVRTRTLQLMGAASVARRVGEPDLARQLNELALEIQPGNVMLYRELAFLELEQGHLDTARRYLEVLSFVDLSDKEPPLALARLLFEQVGQPHKAAEVIRRAYPYSMPPMAVEILAAESYLRGRIDDALNSFHTLASNPLVTVETILDCARMAFAAGRDEGAAVTLDLFLTTAPKDHPSRPRAEVLRKACLLPPSTDAPPPG